MSEEIAREYLMKKYNDYIYLHHSTEYEIDNRKMWCEIIFTALWIFSIITSAVCLDNSLNNKINCQWFLVIEFILSAFYYFLYEKVSKWITLSLLNDIGFYEKRMEEIKKWI